MHHALELFLVVEPVGLLLLASADAHLAMNTGLIGCKHDLNSSAISQEGDVDIADPEQLQAIEAGAPFRRLVERHGAMEITEVRRQRDDWQRQATRELATGRTQAAIARYDAAGAVHGHDTRDDARQALVADWMADRVRDPTASQMLLAYTRADVAELNRLAREVLRAAGQLGPDQGVETTNGERVFAIGDRVMFLRNERSLGVKNGTLGTLAALGRSGMEVRLDDGRSLRFDRKEYADLTHGYAATIHKMQGATVDRAYVLASKHMDRHAAYVALSRHRDAIMVRYGRSDYATKDQLTRSLAGRSSERTMDWSSRERGR